METATKTAIAGKNIAVKDISLPAVLFRAIRIQIIALATQARAINPKYTMLYNFPTLV
ncbi:hypothetical protein LC653_01250 [Nostoc sp. CHAB 5784]|uniref:hypothetical protein n=1 Tax=Nostoc mirabile TaxID=2907820 RepID=UPI001E37FF26|nr:hypothetical protein [Nostoc mirabile]MCC5662592.1 hypothetical protein [Nostoc mirabile CHAB5784]